METKRMNKGLITWVLAGFGMAILVAGKIMIGKDIPKQVPLWYSRPWGKEQLAKPEDLVVIPLVMIGIAILTNLLSERLKKRYQWQQVCEWSGIIAEAILVVAGIRIWTLII